MSFSSDVKEELSRQFPSARHCQIAEIAAIISMCGGVSISCRDRFSLKIQTENLAVARKYFTLLRKTFNIGTEVLIKQHAHLNRSRTYCVLVKNHEDSLKILRAVKLMNSRMEIQENLSLTDNLVIQKSCCKRAFIRGAFLAAGSISDPRKSYHFEIVCMNEHKALQLKEMINTFDMDAKIVQRKKYYVVYIKEGAQIVDILNVMEAHVALMDLENVRILKEMRNSVNRKVNCETANIHKTVSAAVKQIEDIVYIQSTIGFESLSEGLEEIARLRLEQPEATLKELGMMLTPPVGKSGVNHRLRKLSTLAEELRESKEENYYD
ncbi:MAG: DNA-binding protein WhiA [Lachnospiraceae bacterium]|jgi:DNA-binding protein WhiA|nr:DNA-binding protein WhiA [Lachnospiraceae bacterium]